MLRIIVKQNYLISGPINLYASKIRPINSFIGIKCAIICYQSQSLLVGAFKSYICEDNDKNI